MSRVLLKRLIAHRMAAEVICRIVSMRRSDRSIAREIDRVVTANLWTGC